MLSLEKVSYSKYYTTIIILKNNKDGKNLLDVLLQEMHELFSIQ